VDNLIRAQFEELVASLRLAVASAEAEVASALDMAELRISLFLADAGLRLPPGEH